MHSSHKSERHNSKPQPTCPMVPNDSMEPRAMVHGRDGRNGCDGACDSPQPTHTAANKTTSEVGGCSITAATNDKNMAANIKLYLEHPLKCRLCLGPLRENDAELPEWLLDIELPDEVMQDICCLFAYVFCVFACVRSLKRRIRHGLTRPAPAPSVKGTS